MTRRQQHPLDLPRAPIKGARAVRGRASARKLQSMSPATREILAEKQRAWWAQMTPAERSAEIARRLASPEVRERIGAGRRGIKDTDVARAKKAAAQRGRHVSEATRARISAAAKALWAARRAASLNAPPPAGGIGNDRSAPPSRRATGGGAPDTEGRR